jgi:hypothetical protein
MSAIVIHDVIILFPTELKELFSIRGNSCITYRDMFGILDTSPEE